jgi:hypothetical protein
LEVICKEEKGAPNSAGIAAHSLADNHARRVG